MRKISILLAAVALALPGCAGGKLAIPTSITPTSPAPLAQTAIDDVALEAAWRSFDAFLDAINLLIDAKAITPGSAKAKAVADGIDRVKAALGAAENFAAAGSKESYVQALAEAKAGIASIRVALGRTN